MDVKFAHIAPKSCMKQAMKQSQIHMALYHLTCDDEYNSTFRAAKGDVILDNSFYELGKCPPIKKLITAAHQVNAKYVVLPDGTLDGLAELKTHGFGVMAVPAGPDMSAMFKSFMLDENVDLVGLSFYHARLFNKSNNKFDSGARFNFLGTAVDSSITNKKIHCLGMGDTVHEINLMKAYEHLIYSWDSSAAVWAGLHNKHIGLATKKNALSVNFDTTNMFNQYCDDNIKYVNSIIRL